MSNENATEAGKAYWKANLALIRNSLIIWALSSFGMGILFRPLLSGHQGRRNRPGLLVRPAGSILVFLVLIFFTLGA
ncbi:MAG: DUF4212 domain-containing protein [Alphaproteobacteria bacterium]|nr:DUF4212 domain-containing protein [Alphaproteobacteria bacterium]